MDQKIKARRSRLVKAAPNTCNQPRDSHDRTPPVEFSHLRCAPRSLTRSRCLIGVLMVTTMLMLRAIAHVAVIAILHVTACAAERQVTHITEVDVAARVTKRQSADVTEVDVAARAAKR